MPDAPPSPTPKPATGGRTVRTSDLPAAVATIARGAVGVLKATLGVDPAPEGVPDARLLACSRCANWTGNKCELCGCYTALKVRIASEACPLEWWLAVPPPDAQMRHRKAATG